MKIFDDPELFEKFEANAATLGVPDWVFGLDLEFNMSRWTIFAINPGDTMFPIITMNRETKEFRKFSRNGRNSEPTTYKAD